MYSLQCWYIITWFSCLNLCKSNVTKSEIAYVTEVTIHKNAGTSEDQDNQARCSSSHFNSFCCAEDEYHCSESKCIPLSKVCDSGSYGLSNSMAFIRSIRKSSGMDCSKGEDEVGCSNVSCLSRTSKCPHLCLDLPGNKSQCTCHPGYTLVQEKNFHSSHTKWTETCVDIDECNIGSHKCRHGCENLNGTFKCTCREGFKNDPYDHYGTCKADERTIKILYNSGSWIHSYSIEDKKSKQSVPSGRLDNMDYDIHTDIVYWWNKHNRKLQRSYLPGAKEGQVSIGFAQSLDTNVLMDNVQRFSLAVDWMGGNLYWLSKNVLNHTSYDIMASTLDGRYLKTILTVHQASSLTLDAENGMMYWISTHPQYKINSAWMNGWYKNTIYDFKSIAHPTILTLDYSSSESRLFWWDSKSNFIFSGNTDGTNTRKIVSTNSALKPLSMDIFDEYIYWVTNHTHQLVRHNKYGNGETVTLVKNLVHESSVLTHHKNKIDKSAIHKFRQECEENCQQFCFNTPLGFICSCGDGATVNEGINYFTCGTKKLDRFPDPLVCDCSIKEKICNNTSPYSLCHCKASCQHYLMNEKSHRNSRSNHKKQRHTVLIIILGIISLFGVIICFVLSFYKKQSPSLI